MKILHAALIQLNKQLNQVVYYPVNTGDAEKFINQLAIEIMQNGNKRMYTFRSNDTEVVSKLLDTYNNRIDDSITSIFQANCTIIANRLLSSEIKSNQRYPNMKEPKKGSLVIILKEDDGDISITMAKIEAADFLLDTSLTLQTGLPFEKKALKTATISLIPNETIVETEITVTDSGSTIAKYWTDDFLEANEVSSDVKNTINAFNEIDKVLARNLKVQATMDYTELRNNLVGYFKTQPSFNFDGMIEHVFGSYEMENANESIEVVKNKLKSLIEKEKFDTHFDIKPNEIKARFRRTYKVTDEIELRTNGHIDNLRHMIKAKKDNEGNKILEIQIQNDLIFNTFYFEDNDEETI